MSNEYAKLSNGFWVRKYQGLGPYIFGSSGFALVGTSGATLYASAESFTKLDTGFWQRDLDGSGPYVQTAQGEFKLMATGGGGGGGGAVDSVNGQTGVVVLAKSDIGLGNVDNTSDATKNAAAVTLTNKTLTSPVVNTPTGIVKGDVGLGNVDNTSDANKPVSTAQQGAIDAKVVNNLTSSSTIAPAKDAVVAGLALKIDYNAPVALGAGPTSITHAAHTFRDVYSAQTGPASVVFAATGTSGALEGDVVTIRNDGIGRLVASGTVYAAPGMKLFADYGETLVFQYSASLALYISNTPSNAGAFQSVFDGVSFFYRPTFGSSAMMFSTNAPGVAQLDSSTGGSVSFAATKYGGIPKNSQTGAAAAVSRLAGFRGPSPGTTSPWNVPTSGVDYSWRVRIRGAVADAIAAGQFGIGLFSAIPAWTNASEPSAMRNSLFLGADSGDAQMSIMCSNASAVTKTTLNSGTGFPNNTNGVDMYAAEFAWDGLTDVLTFRATNLITGLVAAGVLTATKPVAATALTWAFCRGSANTATTPVMHAGGITTGDFLR